MSTRPENPDLRQKAAEDFNKTHMAKSGMRKTIALSKRGRRGADVAAAVDDDACRNRISAHDRHQS